jgi:hypothetical protein
MSWSERVKELAKGGLIIVALVTAFLLASGALTVLHHASCGRLDADRVSHLMPGHVTRGPDSIYVIGIGPGPPPSQIEAYWEAVSAMERAGCDVPGGR